jgi:hypothetical protein
MNKISDLSNFQNQSFEEDLAKYKALVLKVEAFLHLTFKPFFFKIFYKRG